MHNVDADHHHEGVKEERRIGKRTPVQRRCSRLLFTRALSRAADYRAPRLRPFAVFRRPRARAAARLALLE